MTAPTVGRIVHYVSYGSADGRWTSECRAAIVTETHYEGKDPTAIGLAAINPTGIFFDRECRWSENDHTGGTWHWPCVQGDEVDDAPPPAAFLP